MPLGPPALPLANTQLVETWVAQGGPRWRGPLRRRSLGVGPAMGQRAPMPRAALVATLSLVVLACSSTPAEGGPGDAGAQDAASEAGASCVWNDECPPDQRCACTGDRCACESGPRGKGKVGVDACTTGLECESGVCVDGPDRALCSGRCDAGCGGGLPRCVDVASVGRLCVREPPVVTGAKGTLSGSPWTFDRAFFGFDLSDAGPTATALELHSGSDGTCPPPKRDPRATIVVGGLPGALAATKYGAVRATLFGLDPSLPVRSSSTAQSVEILGIEPCPGGTTGACTIDLRVDFTFPEGSIAGTVRATRCTSMDAP